MERDRRALAQQPETSGIVPLEAPAAGSEQNKALRFTVRKIILLNVTAFNETTLLELLDDTVGQSVSLAELRERIKRISDYYHAHGYLAAYAYLPEQTISENGEVEVQVLEGYLGEIRLHNQSRLSDAAAAGRIPKMKPGNLLQQAPLERSALLTGDIPGVAAQTALNPGKDPGFTDVDITLTDKPLIALQLSADNQGNRYTGDGNRLSLHPEISNLTGYGDKLIANLLSGGFGMKYSQLQYQLPSYWTGDGRVGFEYGEVAYRLGREFLASRSQGTTRTSGLYGSYPLRRSDAVNLSLEVRHQEKMVRDEVLSVSDINERKSYSQTVGVSGDWRDSGINLWNIAYTTGRLDFAYQIHKALDAGSAKTYGHYSKYNWGYTRLQIIPGSDNASLMFSLSGQVNPGRNLDPSEKMVLGGMHGVRAYPSNEGMSDSAILTTLELRYQLTPQLQGVVFYDYGNGVQNSYPWPAVASANKTEIGGAGVGLKFDLFGSGYLEAQGAWRTTKAKPASGSDTPGGRVWVGIGWNL